MAAITGFLTGVGIGVETGLFLTTVFLPDVSNAFWGVASVGVTLVSRVCSTLGGVAV